MRSELAVFVKQVILRPQQVSALAPSSRALARSMVAGIGPETGRVVEFGPGTGRITRAILSRGVAPRDVTLFDLNPVFADRLRQCFPGVTVHVAGAQQVARLCAPGLGAVVSGLPLLSMPPGLRADILRAAFSVLRPDGIFMQFTYGPRPPVADSLLEDLGLIARRGPKVWGNLPPARIYTITRAPA